MKPQTTDLLLSKRCLPCVGGVEKYTLLESEEQVRTLDGWRLTHDGRGICKDWVVRDFAAGMEFLTRVAGLAEQEGHHPDLRLEGYRNVRIEMWTHAIGGLSQNDFILAAKIDQLPVLVRE